MITKGRSRNETLKRTWTKMSRMTRCPHWKSMRNLAPKTRQRAHQRTSAISARLGMMGTFSCCAILVTMHVTCTVASQFASVSPRVTGSAETAKRPRRQPTMLQPRQLKKEIREKQQAMTPSQHPRRPRKMHQKRPQEERNRFPQQQKPLRRAQEEQGQRPECNYSIT